jgi:hypothetical protein
MASVSFIRSGKLIGLLSTADPTGQMFVMVKATNRLALGSDPFNPSLTLDLTKEITAPYLLESSAANVNRSGEALNGEHKDHPPSSAPTLHHVAHGLGRDTGKCWFRMNGQRTECRSRIELLTSALQAIELMRPGTSEKLSHIKKRTKRIIARNPTELFESQHLVRDYAKQLGNGWWIGTNNSSAETRRWLIHAVECAGLRWGSDFDTSI